MTKPAVFLDRDGVLNLDKGYVFKTEDFEWIRGAKEAIKYLNKKNYYVFVVTNQSGIARGYYSEKDLTHLHSYINNELNKYDSMIDEFFYSPYHSSDKSNRYIHLKHLRKPNTGMLDLAFEKWNIDKSSSFMIGDSEKDLSCAKNFGIKGYLFDGINLLDFVKKILI